MGGHPSTPRYTMSCKEIDVRKWLMWRVSGLRDKICIGRAFKFIWRLNIRALKDSYLITQQNGLVKPFIEASLARSQPQNTAWLFSPSLEKGGSLEKIILFRISQMTQIVACQIPNHNPKSWLLIQVSKEANEVGRGSSINEYTIHLRTSY